MVQFKPTRLLGHIINTSPEAMTAREATAEGYLPEDVPLLQSLRVLPKDKIKKPLGSVEEIKQFFRWATGNEKYPLPPMVRIILCMRRFKLIEAMDSLKTTDPMRTYEKNAIVEIDRFLKEDGHPNPAASTTPEECRLEGAKEGSWMTGGVVTIPTPATSSDCSQAELLAKLAEIKSTVQVAKATSELKLDEILGKVGDCCGKSSGPAGHSSALQAALEAAKRELANATSKYNAAEADKVKLQKELDSVKQSYDENVGKCGEELEKAKAELAKAQAAVETAEEAKAAAEEAKAAAEADITAANEKIAAAEKAAAEARTAAEEARTHATSADQRAAAALAAAGQGVDERVRIAEAATAAAEAARAQAQVELAEVQQRAAEELEVATRRAEAAEAAQRQAEAALAEAQATTQTAQGEAAAATERAETAGVAQQQAEVALALARAEATAAAERATAETAAAQAEAAAATQRAAAAERAFENVQGNLRELQTLTAELAATKRKLETTKAEMAKLPKITKTIDPERYQQLSSVLQTKGKSIDDLIKLVNSEQGGQNILQIWKQLGDTIAKLSQTEKELDAERKRKATKGGTRRIKSRGSNRRTYRR